MVWILYSQISRSVLSDVSLSACTVRILIVRLLLLAPFESQDFFFALLKRPCSVSCQSFVPGIDNLDLSGVFAPDTWYVYMQLVRYLVIDCTTCLVPSLVRVYRLDNSWISHPVVRDGQLLLPTPTKTIVVSHYCNVRWFLL